MSARRSAWLLGSVASALLVGSVAWYSPSRELAPPLGLLALAITALIAEAAGLRPAARRRSGPRPPEGARPADGMVEIVEVVGAVAVPLADDPRWRRFLRLLDDRPGPRPAGLPTDTPALLGRVALISIFVGRDGRPWTDAEITWAHQSLERAGLWLEREAIRRDAPVNVGLADTFFRVEDDADEPVEVAYADEGDDVGPMEADAATKALAGASRAAARLGFADIADLFGRFNPRVEADARVWLLHLRRAGRSIAVPASESDISGVGLAACYAREASFPEPLAGPGRVDPVTVVHELLHLFGASDKYGVPLRSYPAGSVTSRDVMRLDFESLSRMTIDPMTAREIGWEDRVATGPRKKTARDR